MRIEIYGDAKADGAGEMGAYAWMALKFTLSELKRPVPQVMDSDAFSQLWAQGALVLVGLYDDTELVGCRIVSINSHLLSSTVMVASGVLIFVDPRYRRRGLATEMITVSNKYLEEERNCWLFDEVALTGESRELFSGLGYGVSAFMMSRGA